jgi:hypothetical protein
MDNTPSVEEMTAIVQAYIREKKGVNVRIVFDDMFSIRKHTIMLNEAYNYVMATTNQKIKS